VPGRIGVHVITRRQSSSSELDDRGGGPIEIVDHHIQVPLLRTFGSGHEGGT
jgi:hypothetical protein